MRNFLCIIGLLGIGSILSSCSVYYAPTGVYRGQGSVSWLYEVCDTVDDCELSADGCYDVEYNGWATAMCSNQCDSDLQCIGDAACLALDPLSDAICYARCVDQDCPSGFECTPLEFEDGTADWVCLP